MINHIMAWLWSDHAYIDHATIGRPLPVHTWGKKLTVTEECLYTARYIPPYKTYLISTSSVSYIESTYGWETEGSNLTCARQVMLLGTKKILHLSAKLFPLLTVKAIYLLLSNQSHPGNFLELVQPQNRLSSWFLETFRKTHTIPVAICLSFPLDLCILGYSFLNYSLIAFLIIWSYNE